MYSHHKTKSRCFSSLFTETSHESLLWHTQQLFTSNRLQYCIDIIWPTVCPRG